jgi:putative ABC transport system substrate-binding protein
MRRRDFIALLGGGAAWPVVGRAQQRASVIGFLHQGSPEPLSLMNAFRKGLSEVGLIEGHNITIEDRAADGHYDRLPALAAELVEHGVAVIAANYLPAALAAKAATQAIPIVFLSGSDPIGAGLVSSMSRPAGNVTGIAPMFTLLGTKNLELLHELAPNAPVIAVLANLTNPNAEHQLKDLETAARILGLDLIVLAGSNEREIEQSFAAMAERRIGALVVTADGFLISRHNQIVELAARYAVPTMYPLSQYAAAGGLMSYGANLPDAFLQTGIYVGKDPQGCAARGSAGSTADQNRVCPQSQNRQGAWSPSAR